MRFFVVCGKDDVDLCSGRISVSASALSHRGAVSCRMTDDRGCSEDIVGAPSINSISPSPDAERSYGHMRHNRSHRRTENAEQQAKRFHSGQHAAAADVVDLQCRSLSSPDTSPGLESSLSPHCLLASFPMAAGRKNIPAGNDNIFRGKQSNSRQQQQGSSSFHMGSRADRERVAALREVIGILSDKGRPSSPFLTLVAASAKLDLLMSSSQNDGPSAFQSPTAGHGGQGGRLTRSVSSPAQGLPGPRQKKPTGLTTKLNHLPSGQQLPVGTPLYSLDHSSLDSYRPMRNRSFIGSDVLSSVKRSANSNMKC